MKKKVLQFIHGLPMGGAETLVKEYCLKLDKEKYDVSVLCFYQYHTPYETLLEEAGIKVTYINDISDHTKEGHFRKLDKLRLYLRRIFYVKAYVKKEAPDIIHTHLNNNTYVWLAKPKKGTRIFHSVHSEPKELWDQSFDSRIDQYAAKKLIKTYGMRFITLHEEMKDEINTMFGVQDSEVLNNGIDFSWFECALPKKQVREREHIPQDAFVIGHTGRFNENKNQDFLVDIFNEIHQKNPKAYLLMIGKGDTLPEIEAQLQRLGLEKNCQILSYRTDVPNLLSAMDCFVFPSKYEGLGIALIEAQKMKLPCVVSSTIPGAAEISNLVKRMDLTLSAKEWAAEIEKFSVQTVEYHGLEEWDMNRVIKKLETIYESEGRG